MKLKLDLHPLFNDSRKIEAALQSVVDDAVDKRATEVEIIPGKGSGALKKTVLRFLERPEIKSLYHRVEKDGDNWGRLFVHFRHNRPAGDNRNPTPETIRIQVPCACCSEEITFVEPESELPGNVLATCPWCGSPNSITLRRDRRGIVHATAELDYPQP